MYIIDTLIFQKIAKTDLIEFCTKSSTDLGLNVVSLLYI